MKTVEEVMKKSKSSVDEIKTGKGAFSVSGFNDLTNALVNDTSYQIKTYDKKTGEETGSVSVSDLIRGDLKKTMAKAKWPSKSEESVLDTCEISTDGLAKAIPQIVMQSISTGKKFDLPPTAKSQGSIYLADVKGKEKTTTVRDPKDQVPLGTVKTVSKDWIQVRAKSSTPPHLQTKTRYDVNGNKIK